VTATAGNAGPESPTAVPRRALLVFVDGVGLGEDDAQRNALAADWPALGALLAGGRAVRAATPLHAPSASLVALDATLGMPGLPQSGTGQAALLTGLDAVALHGRHFGPWVPTRLRPLVECRSLLATARVAGRSVAFANAYPEEVLAARDGARPPPFLRAGPPLAALGAGVLDRHTAALERGDAVASEITNEAWRRYLGRSGVPDVDAATAGRNLARIAAAHAVTLFAHYATDTAGHRRDLAAARRATARVDAFLAGLFEHLGDGTLVVVASDHGNLEDCTAGHTRNPALGLLAGPGHTEAARSMTRITDVAPTLLRALGIEPAATAPADGA
jgi:2,3-bisphosphoglycerate-independent phosphoglycerate mutase